MTIDNLVICCKGQAEEAMAAMRQIMGRIKLRVNEEKTSICRLPEKYFDFLGYTFGRFYSTKTGRAYLGTRPSKRSVKRLIEAISETTNPRTTWLPAATIVEQLNRKLTGWANYFSLGPVSKAYQAIDSHTTTRLRRWLCIKHKVRGGRVKRYPAPYLHQTLGLVSLPSFPQRFPWANV